MTASVRVGNGAGSVRCQFDGTVLVEKKRKRLRSSSSLLVVGNQLSKLVDVGLFFPFFFCVGDEWKKEKSNRS